MLDRNDKFNQQLTFILKIRWKWKQLTDNNEFDLKSCSVRKSIKIEVMYNTIKKNR